MPHPVNEYGKMRITNKTYQTNMVLFFLRYLECLTFEVLGVDYFGRYHTKIYEKQNKLYDKNF